MSNAEYRQGYEVGQADMKQDGITVADALDVLRAAGWTVAADVAPDGAKLWIASHREVNPEYPEYPEVGGSGVPYPPFDPDPDLVDHLEGNGWARKRYKRDAEQARGDKP